MELAIALLKKRGQMDNHGRLTALGRERNSLTARERAIDRASKSSTHPKEDFIYNPKTNRATLRKK